MLSLNENLKILLGTLNLKSFIENYQSMAEKAEQERLSHTSYLNELAVKECERRNQQKIVRLLKYSRCPRDKRLESFDTTRIPGLSLSLVQKLAEGEFIDRCENILIFGNPGTGKSHLCMALCQKWCLKGRRVLYITAANLVQELLRAKATNQLDYYIKKLDRFEVLVIDDISYVPCDRTETDVLFMLLAERYEQRSVVITSNLIFSQWHQIFKDEMTTAAVIDRLVHHATILELNTTSYRVTEAKNRKQLKKEKEVEI